MKGLFNRHQVDPVRLVKEFRELLALAQPDLSHATYTQFLEVAELADERLGLDPTTAVVALVGATGSGKSSLFNALLGADLAPTGVRRPTTTEPIAAVQISASATRLLDWLEIKHRVQIPADGLLPDNVALIDLPDVDSIAAKGREVVSFLAKRVDLLVWVTDPQKYADNLLHTEFIRPLAKHAQTTIAVLTKSDLLAANDLQVVTADLQRILEAAQVNRPQVVAVSATEGTGVNQLRALLAEAATEQLKQSQKLLNALEVSKEQLVDEVFAGKPLAEVVPAFNALTQTDLQEPLRKAVYEVARVPLLQETVAASYRYRAGLACGFWPLRKLRLLKADPAKRLHLEGINSVRNLEPSQPALQALEVSVQAKVSALQSQLPQRWYRQVQGRAVSGVEAISEEISVELAQVELPVQVGKPTWWKVANWVQLLGWVTALVGGGWLFALQVARNLLLIELPVSRWAYVPVPVWLLVAGIIVASTVSLVTYVIVGYVSKKVARQSIGLLAQRLDKVTERVLIDPIGKELERQLAILQKLVK
ncbi:MAG: dynamin family protein [Actinomycetaceae bacterium]|nr:dynamin family protein [Actinomycetaceae bacterium]